MFTDKINKWSINFGKGNLIYLVVPLSPILIKDITHRNIIQY